MMELIKQLGGEIMTQDLKLAPEKLKEIFTKITSRLVLRDEDERAGTVDNLYDAVVNVISEITNAQACSLYLEQESRDNEAKTINMVAGAGYEAPLIKKSSYLKGEGVTGWIWEHGEAKKFDSHEELKNSGIWQGKYDKEKGEKEGKDGRRWEFWSNVMVPLKINGRVIGVLKAENKLVNGNKVAFTQEEFHILEIIAGTIALAIEDRRTSEKAYVRIIDAIRAISSILAKREVITSRSFYKMITKECISIFNAKACSLFIKQPIAGEEIIDLEAGEGYEENLTLKSAYKKGEGLTGWIWQSGESVRFDSHEKIISHPSWRGKYDPEKSLLNKGWKCWSVIGVPLMVGTESIGVLKVENKIPEPNHFTDVELRTLQILARIIALAVEMRNYQVVIFEMGLQMKRELHDTNRDIRNVKTSINNAIRMIQQTWNRGEIIRTLNNAVDNLDSVKDRLTRTYEGERKDRIELTKIFNALRERMKYSIKKKNIQFDVVSSHSVSNYLIYLDVSFESITEAFSNVIVNSMEEFEQLENNPEFQPKLLIKIERDTDKNFLDIYIVDNGKGLSEKKHTEFEEKKVCLLQKNTEWGLV